MVTSPVYIIPSSFEGKNHPISPIKTKADKSQFLQKLSCPKPYWDQPRLSSLVNNQVVRNPDGTRLDSSLVNKQVGT